MTGYASARARLAQIASDNGLTALAFVPGSNFHYLSGLAFHLMERPTLMFVTADNQVLGIIPELERQIWSSTFPNAQTFYWQDSDGYEAAFNALAAALPTGTIGVEGMLMRAFEEKALAIALGDNRVQLVDQALSSLRLQKSDIEVAALRRAIEISEAALGEVLDELHSGQTEADIVAALKMHMLQHGADGFAFDPIVLIGENAALPHGEPGQRQVGSGDAVLIDFGAQYDGFNADITRTVFFDHVTDRQAEIYETVLAANAQGRAVAGPKLLAEDLDIAVTAVLKASPFAELIVHKTGHGLGREVHEAPQIMVGNTAPLVPGIVLTIEPGLYAPGELGVRIEDDVLITESGCDSLTSFSRALRVVKKR